MICEKMIQEYVEKEKNGDLVSVDMERGEFIYRLNSGLEMKGFVENAEEWASHLDEIDGKKCIIAKWWKEKDQLGYDMLKGESEDGIHIKKETQKAFLLTNNANTDMWIPKSCVTWVE